jgi:hypothetical protein
MWLHLNLSVLKKIQILLLFCAVFFCAASAYAQLDTAYSCAWSKQWLNANPQTKEEAIERYDSLRLYVKRCASGDDQSYRAFSPLDGAVALYSTDTGRFDSYRDWLISVLYLNTTNPAYFCSCLYSISGTYGYGKYHITNAGLAVLNYLRQNPNCTGTGLENEYQQDSLYNVHHGISMHLPPLDSIGLGFLLKGKVNLSPSSPLSSQCLISFSSNPNPFTFETKLNFALNRMTYVTIEVYDLLGNKVYGTAGRSYEAGSYEISLDCNVLPNGSLYARISTGFGEVKTVKLVHEK